MLCTLYWPVYGEQFGTQAKNPTKQTDPVTTPYTVKNQVNSKTLLI